MTKEQFEEKLNALIKPVPTLREAELIAALKLWKQGWDQLPQKERHRFILAWNKTHEALAKFQSH